MQLKLKDYQANNLKSLLSVIPKEALFSEGLLENKWQALTCRSKILNAIKDINTDFDKKLEEVDKVLAQVREENKVLNTDYAEPKDEKPEDKKTRMKEREKAEEVINNKLKKDLEKTGLNVGFFSVAPQVNISLISYIDDKEAKTVELKLDEKHKQLEFIKDQFERNIFTMRIPDDTLSEIAEILGL